MFTLAALHFLSSLGQNSGIGVVHFVEFIVIDIGSLDDLDLSNLHVLHGVDGGHILGDLLLNDLAGEHIEDLSDVGLSDFL